MHAVVIRDGQLHWEEREDPVPGDTELLVAVEGAGLNSADLMQRAGFYPAPPGWPADIPGMEFAGEVKAVGAKVTLFAPGARVMAVVGGGAQATMALVDEAHALAVPDSLPWPEAGGFPEAFTTAFDALFTQAGLAMGERVLVSGAAGGVGTAGVQLAAATGATVVATVRRPSRHAEVAALGAAVVIDPGDVAAHGPYDVVLELVGVASLPTVLPHLATGARVVVIGVGSGAQVEINLLQLMGARARIGGSTLRPRTRSEKADVASAMTAHVLPLLAAGRIRVPISATFPMAEATAAYEEFAAAGKLGKVVLVNFERGRPVIEAVLFDGDQTLWDFQKVMRHALIAVLDHLRAARPGPATSRLQISDLQDDRTEVARELSGVEFSLARLRQLGFARTLHRLRESGGDWSESDDEKLAVALTVSYFDHRDRDPALFDDTLPCLESLRPHYRLGLLSNGSRLPETIGLGGYFEAVVFAQDHRVAKPDRGLFTVVEQQMHLAPDRAVLVGDHRLNDVVGAKQAGWRAVWIDRGGDGIYRAPEGYDDQPDAIIASLRQLPEVLARF